jgi:hypothetical protein
MSCHSAEPPDSRGVAGELSEPERRTVGIAALADAPRADREAVVGLRHGAGSPSVGGRRTASAGA